MRIGFGLALVLVTLLGLGAGAGYAAYQRSTATLAAAAAPASANRSANGATSAASANAGGQGLGAGGGRALMGTVDKAGERELTLKTTGISTTVTVRLDDQITVTKQVTGTIADLQPGARVSVQGETGADGVIAATLVQLLPADGAGFPGGGGLGGQRAQPGAAGTPPAGAAGGSPRGTRSQVDTQGTPPAQSGAPASAARGTAPLIGTLKEVSGSSATVSRGDTAEASALVKVTFSEKTGVVKTVAGTPGDLSEGTYVWVSGTQQGDGVFLATSIQILPPEAAQSTGRGAR